MVKKSIVVVGVGSHGDAMELLHVSSMGHWAKTIPDNFQPTQLTRTLNGDKVRVTLMGGPPEEKFPDSLAGWGSGMRNDKDAIFLICSVVKPGEFLAMDTKYVEHIQRQIPNRPIFLFGTDVQLRDDSRTVARLARIAEQPISTQEGIRLAQEWGCEAYYEYSNDTREAQDAIDEAFRLTYEIQQQGKGFKKKRHSFLCIPLYRTKKHQKTTSVAKWHRDRPLAGDEKMEGKDEYVMGLSNHIREGSVDKMQLMLRDARRRPDQKSSNRFEEYVKKEALFDVLKSKADPATKLVMIDVLLESGATVLQLNKDGESLLMVAKETNQSNSLIMKLQHAVITQSEEQDKLTSRRIVSKGVDLVKLVSDRVINYATLGFKDRLMTVHEFASSTGQQQQAVQKVRDKADKAAQGEKKASTSSLALDYRKLTKKQKEKISMFESLIELRLSELFIKSLAISNGFADDPEKRAARAVADSINFAGSLVPIPLAGAFVRMLTDTGRVLHGKKNEGKFKRQALEFKTLKEANAVVELLVSHFTIRYQFIVAQLEPNSIDPFVITLLKRMCSYLTYLPSHEYGVDLLSSGLIDLSQTRRGPHKSSHLSPGEEDIPVNRRDSAANIADNLIMGASIGGSTDNSTQSQEKERERGFWSSMRLGKKVTEHSDSFDVCFYTTEGSKQYTTAARIARWAPVIGLVGTKKYAYFNYPTDPDGRTRQQLNDLPVIFLQAEEIHSRELTQSNPWNYSLFMDPPQEQMQLYQQKSISMKRDQSSGQTSHREFGPNNTEQDKHSERNKTGLDNQSHEHFP